MGSSNAVGAVSADTGSSLSLLRQESQHFRGKHSIHTPATHWCGSSCSGLFHGASVWRLANGAQGGVKVIHPVEVITQNGFFKGGLRSQFHRLIASGCLYHQPLRSGCQVLLTRMPKIPLASATKGFEDYQFSIWIGVQVSAKTPDAQVAALHKAAYTALGNPELRKIIEAAGSSVAEPMSLAQLDAFYKKEVIMGATIAKSIKLEPQSAGP